MEIDANELTIGALLQNDQVFYKIPVYQRGYSWGRDQLDDFWDDLHSLEEGEEHFIGSIVVINKKAMVGNYNKSEIVDGQQRMVTIALFINAMKNILKEKKKNESEEDKQEELPYWKEIENKYLYSKKAGFAKINKIELGNVDKDCYKSILHSKFEDVKSKNILKAYDFLYDNLKDFSFNEIKQLFDKLMDNFKVVMIETDSPKSAFRLFEALNDRGLDLSSVDLIKNHILSLAARDESNEGKQEFYMLVELWDKIIRNLEDVDKVRFFRQYIMSSKLRAINKKVTQDKLYDEFCSIIDKLKDVNTYIRDLTKQSETYKKICTSTIDLFDRSTNEVINNHLRNLEAIKATTSYTLLLRAFVELKEKPKEIVELIRLIEIFAIRRIIANWSTAELDRIYNKLALESFEKDNALISIKEVFSSNVPDDTIFESNFETRTFQLNDQLKYILDTIEEQHYGHGGKKIQNRYAVHIEHIMPQTWNTLDFAPWKEYLDIDEDTHWESRNLIGNLTLLEEKPNIQASNKPFEEKKQFYGKDKTEMMMTHKLLECSEWNLEAIKQRSKDLAKIATKVWRF